MDPPTKDDDAGSAVAAAQVAVDLPKQDGPVLQNEPATEPEAADPPTKDDAAATVRGPTVQVAMTDGCKTADFDIVIIVNRYGDDEEEDITPDSSWVLHLANARSWNARVIRLYFDTDDLERSNFSRASFNMQAAQLLQVLSTLRAGQDPPLPLAFFAPDIGGIILKEALNLASIRRDDSVRLSTCFLAFFTCPHRWASVQELEDGVSRFLRSRDKPTSRVDYAKCLARTIININTSFVETRALNRANVVNMYSTKDDIDEQIFGESMTSLQTPLEMRIAADRSYEDLLVLGEEKTYGLMERAMERAREFPMLHGRTKRLADMFEDQAAPVRPLRLTAGRKYGGLGDNEFYQLWRDGPQPSIMHVFGAEDVSDAAEYVFEDVESARVDVGSVDYHRCIQYFKFVRDDVRRNSVRAMVETFLSQICGEWRNSPLRDWLGLQDPPDFDTSWSGMDALCYLNKVRIQLGASAGCTWIIDGLDQCDDSRNAFMTEISNIMSSSEQYFKVFITSVGGPTIFPAVSGSSIDVQQITAPDKTDVTSVDYTSLIDLSNSQPELYWYHEHKIREILSACKDEGLRLLVADSLNKKHTWVTVEDLEALSPPTAEKAIHHTLQSIPKERRSWAQTVIALVLHSFRPLAPEELSAGLAMAEVRIGATDLWNRTLNIVEELNRYFGRLLVIDNGEVVPGHPAVRSMFLDPKFGSRYGMPLLSSREQIHSFIAVVCLRFLALPSVQERHLKSCIGASTTRLLFERGFSTYSLQFWAQHYRLGSFQDELDGHLKILQDPKNMFVMAAARWFQLNPLVRADRSFLSPLPVLASFGLEQLIALLMEQQPPDDEEISLALTEAAREGYAPVVQFLLKSSTISQEGSLDACVAAARSGHAEVLEILVKYVLNAFKDVRWPQILLSRVAFLHLNTLLDALLEAGMDPNPQDHSEFSPPLHCAIVSRNNTGVDMLLEHSADPNLRNTRWKDWPPILTAAKLGHADIVKRLIQAGASVEASDETDRTPLAVAALCGNHKVLQVLLDAGADKKSAEVSCWEKIDEKPIISAASMCYFEVLRVLLEHGVDANVDPAKTDRKTALAWVAFQERADLCSMLLENGVDPNGTDIERPLVTAVESRSVAVVQALLDHDADVNVILQPNSDPSTPLIAAARLNLTEIAKLLMDKGADINLMVSSGDSPLLVAANNGSAEMTKLLVDAGADIAKPSGPRERLPLHACNQHAECLKILLDAGSDIDANCKDGTTLYMAAYWNHPVEVDILISRGANLELTCLDPQYWDTGCTAIHCATHEGNSEIVETLLEAGANIEAKMPDGSTALILAVKESKEKVAQALLEYNPSVNALDNERCNVLHHINDQTPLSLIRLLVRRGVNLEQRSKDGYTVLRSAVQRSELDTVSYLLDRKANINTAEGFFGGPLHIAAFFRDVAMVKLLVDRGADVNLLHKGRGGTPLMIAYFREDVDEEKEPVLKYLIEEAGVHVNAHGGFFGSALNLAVLCSSVERIKFIFDKVEDKNFADDFGRRPIHYAAMRSVEHVQFIMDVGGDLRLKNKTGQTALHLSVGTGRVDLVEFILSRTKDLINEPDKDGWTPLHWAVRPSHTWGMPADTDVDIIKLLLSHGADVSAIGQSYDQLWAPIKLATYFRASDEILALLKPNPTKGVAEEARDQRFYTSHRAVEDESYYCDGCLWGLYGMYHNCAECAGRFYLCFKCWRRKDEYHPQHKEWELNGLEDETMDEPEAPAATGVADGLVPLVEQVKDDDAEGDWSDADGG